MTLEKEIGEEERGLEQEHLADLLIEAANPICRSYRRNRIHIELVEASHRVNHPDPSEDSENDDIEVVIGQLFERTPRHRLISLFPAFAAMCSSEPIDWDIDSKINPNNYPQVDQVGL